MIFTSLQIESRCKDSNIDFPTMQDALSAAFSETLPDTFRERCPNCGGPWARKIQDVDQVPETLLLQIKRWEDWIAPDGEYRPRRRPSSMRMDRTVTLKGTTYNLQGIIYQKGDTPGSGHYVAVARHGDGPEPFFAYNDSHRQGVNQAAIACDMANIPGAWRRQMFYATALLYDRST